LCIDSQAVEGRGKKRGPGSIRRIDAAQKQVKGKKRISWSTPGLMLHGHRASGGHPDRDGGRLDDTRCSTFPFLTRLLADGGFRPGGVRESGGPAMLAVGGQIVKRS